jgi:class 3 adenylate cyclase
VLDSNLEGLVENLLTAYGIETAPVSVRRVGNSSFRPSFIARAPRASRTAIAIQQGRVDSRFLYALDGWYDEARARKWVDKLLLVTPQPPSDEDRKRFTSALDGDDALEWIGVGQLPARLGITDDLDLTSPLALDQLQQATVARIAQAEAKDAARLSEALNVASLSEKEPSVHRSLARQLSTKSLSDVDRAGRPVEKALRIGEELRPFVLLSDIKSFSTLVRVGDPAVIQQMMNAYYRRARQIIWANNGVLDKFIGDAVLAIWGYPEPAPEDAGNAVRAATELIMLGRSLLEEFQSRHNEAIESGTRVGIASDEVLVLNIGTDQVEVSFVGNGINLAARLEAASLMDGILMDNRTKAALASTWPDVERLAAPEEVLLDEKHAKGQLTSIRAWQVPSAGVDRMLEAKPPSPIAGIFTPRRQAARAEPAAG